MSFQRFNPNTMTPTELKVHLASMQTELHFKALELAQRKLEFDRIQAELDKRQDELEQKTIELTDMRVKFEGTRVELLHKSRRRPFVSKVLAFIVCIFFGLTTVLFNHANSLVDAKDPNANIYFSIAIILYVGCA